MSLRRSSRFVALFALALALLAALPCSVLANEGSCCGASASCGDAAESPCAQLAATPCCEAGGAPIDASFAPQLPVLDYFDVQDFHLPPPFITNCSVPPRVVPLRDSISIRSIVLQL